MVNSWWLPEQQEGWLQPKPSWRELCLLSSSTVFLHHRLPSSVVVVETIPSPNPARVTFRLAPHSWRQPRPFFIFYPGTNFFQPFNHPCFLFLQFLHLPLNRGDQHWRESPHSDYNETDSEDKGEMASRLCVSSYPLGSCELSLSFWVISVSNA